MNTMPRPSPRPYFVASAGVVATVLVAALTGAQSRPNFAGLWKVVRADSVGTPTYGDTFRASQTDTALTLRVTVGEVTYDAPYKLDGTESNYEPTAGARVAAVAHWEGSTLVVVTRAMHPVRPQEVTRRLRVDAAGRLHVETLFSTSDRRTTTVYQRQ